MGYAHKCTRCGVMFERGIPTLRVVTGTRENVPLCDKCTEDLRRFIKGAAIDDCHVNTQRRINEFNAKLVEVARNIDI